MRVVGRCLLFLLASLPLANSFSATLTRPSTASTRIGAPMKAEEEPRPKSLPTPPPETEEDKEEERGRKKAPTPLQKLAFEIAITFIPGKFDPLIADCHVQTIGGFFLRDTPAAYLPRNQPISQAKRIIEGIRKTQEKSQNKQPFWDSRETIETPDGDFFHADTKYAADDTASMVIMLHGLESNSDSDLSKQIASACVANGMSFTCVNFRSCSQDEDGNLIPNVKLWGYHLGFTEDVMQYLDICAQRRPYQKRYLMGFSLGANAALKALGELGEEAVEKYNIRGASLLCTPFDQERNSKVLAEPGINRAIYTSSLLKKMKAKAQEKLDAFCDGNPDTTDFDYKRAMEAETITVFDDAFIAPIYDYEDCWDYYRKTSSIYFMEDVAVPTYVVNADNDPFFDCELFPVEKTLARGGRAPIIMQQTRSGGHLGFCFHQVNEEDPRLQTDGESWAPVEAARFLKHVEKNEVQLKNWYF